jgi:hypothetical protein
MNDRAFDLTRAMRAGGFITPLLRFQQSHPSSGIRQDVE